MSLSPSWLGVAAAAAVLLGLAGCASDQPQRHAEGRGLYGEGAHGHGGWREGRANLFISPAGQPFRGAPGDPYPVAAWFAAADADHDGKLTLQEFLADARRFFDQLDANHDGVLDGAEVSVYEHTVAPEILAASARGGGAAAGQGQWSGGGGRMGGGGGMGHHGHRRGSGDSGQGASAPQLSYQGAAPYSLIPLAEPVTAADADFNGRITLQEFLAAAQRRFDALDTTNAGHLTLDGLPRTPVQARRAERGADGHGG